MRVAILLTAICFGLAACTTPEQTEQYRQTCLSYGHEPGTPALASCIEGKSKQGSAAATKVGTSVLTGALLGAI